MTFDSHYVSVFTGNGAHVVNITCPNCGKAHVSEAQMINNVWELKCLECEYEWGQEARFIENIEVTADNGG